LFNSRNRNCTSANGDPFGIGLVEPDVTATELGEAVAVGVGVVLLVTDVVSAFEHAPIIEASPMAVKVAK